MIGSVFDASEFTRKLKATIQKTGKLGFTSDTIATLGLKHDTHVCFAPDDEDNDVLYMGVMSDVKPQYFRLLKSSEYFCVPTTKLFDSLGYDYKNTTIIFDIARCEEFDEAIGGECYKLTKRDVKKK